MAKFYQALDDELIAFIEAQPMFFIASAGAEGRVNLSPKGLDTTGWSEG
jgi:predicted pyridoxine 5'-phosphate oxidase superfamily flavin-nucleotide-binding protein